MWEVEYTDQFGEWYESLEEADQEPIRTVVERLAEHGPSLRRPTVAEIKGSRFDPQMRELRIGSVRVLFMFDPRRVAILLVGGDKSGAWKEWYVEAIREADRLYEEHLGEI